MTLWVIGVVFSLIAPRPLFPPLASTQRTSHEVRNVPLTTKVQRNTKDSYLITRSAVNRVELYRLASPRNSLRVSGLIEV